MGLNLALNMLEHGHEVVGNARTRATVDKAVAQGVIGAYSLEELVGKLMWAPPTTQSCRRDHFSFAGYGGLNNLFFIAVLKT